MGVPLIRRTFQQADKLIVAMEARCYSENRTDSALSASRLDWTALLIIIIVCGWIVSI
jgi:energy-coupling factor transporter transmembrane protein EcfT